MSQVVEQPVEAVAPAEEVYQQQPGLLNVGMPGQIGLMMPQIGAGFQPAPFQAKFGAGLEPASGLLQQSLLPTSNFVFYAEAPASPAYGAGSSAAADTFTVPTTLKTRDAGLVSKREKPNAWCQCFNKTTS